MNEIAVAVVNRDYLAQGCFTLLTTDTSAQMSPAQARGDLVKFCMGVIQSGQAR